MKHLKNKKSDKEGADASTNLSVYVVYSESQENSLC